MKIKKTFALNSPNYSHINVFFRNKIPESV